MKTKELGERAHRKAGTVIKELMILPPQRKPRKQLTPEELEERKRKVSLRPTFFFGVFVVMLTHCFCS